MSAAQGTGFGIMTDNGVIDMRTVCESSRAARVNWLVVQAGIWISQAHTDADIEKLWHDNCGAAEVVRVRVSQLKTV